MKLSAHTLAHAHTPPSGGVCRLVQCGIARKEKPEMTTTATTTTSHGSKYKRQCEAKTEQEAEAGGEEEEEAEAKQKAQKIKKKKKISYDFGLQNFWRAMNQQQLRVHTQNVPTGSDVDSDSAHTIKQRPQKERGGDEVGAGRHCE